MSGGGLRYGERERTAAGYEIVETNFDQFDDYHGYHLEWIDHARWTLRQEVPHEKRQQSGLRNF
jgi:hypothetical protein